jgi:hypothetical protein
MKIIRVSKAGEVCKQPNKSNSGKLDSQLFVGPEGSACDRNIAKKNRKKKKKQSDTSESQKVTQAKKRKKKKSTEEAEKFQYNPWAICTKTVGRDNKDKYERCVQEVKKKERKKKEKR